MFVISLILTAGCDGVRPASLISGSGTSVSIEKEESPASVSIIETPIETQTEEKETVRIPELKPDPIPEGTWQKDVSFPHWAGYVDDTLAMNSMISFRAYKGQGKIYILPGTGTGSFSLYVNETLIDTSACQGGEAYSLDISGLVFKGRNTVQVSNILPAGTGKVRLLVPYPEVIPGKPEDEGISDDALEFISDLVEADVENGFPGASLAVLRHGRLVYEKAWGSLNSFNPDGTKIQDPVPAKTDTLYDLASVTKMFSVNYAIQKLVTDGIVSVNDRIADHLGKGFYNDTISIKYSGRAGVSLDTQKQWKSELTIRDLLAHQGGFPADPRYFHPDANQATQGNGAKGGNVLFSGNGADPETKANTLKQIFKTPLMYKPGTETLYSDVDYMVLGFLVEAVTGKDLDVYLKETFWDPMGLTRITYDPLTHGFTKDDCAATELNGNTRDGGVFFDGIRNYTLQGEVHDEKAWYCMGGVSGHAGLFASAGDLARLASVMLTGGYGNNRFFGENVMDLFMAPKSQDYPTWGLGWWREADDGRAWYFGTQADSETVGHQGWTGTLVMIDPSRDLVIVYLTNKINSKVTDPKKNLNRFNGSRYTSATLGFVPQILSIGMDSGADVKEQLLDLSADLIGDAISLIPANAAKGAAEALNAKAKIDLLETMMRKLGSDKYRDLAKEKLAEIEELLPDEKGPSGDASDNNREITLGDERPEEYLPLLKDKRVAVFSNHTGIVGNDGSKGHIVDELIRQGIEVTAVFAPEHGFRGDLDAGAAVSDSKDAATGIPIYSADGESLKNLSGERLGFFDTLVVDIQDVGVRFYTYHITMQRLMEMCAEAGKQAVILDRPNPNGFYTDGPILEDAFRSNVGVLPVPVVHGLTLGELALMINGEGWLKTGAGSCDLKVIPCKGYTHESKYRLTVAPSPNLKTMQAIYLYPSTCYFENTAVSCGRGTEDPFVIFGSPYLPDSTDYPFVFTPEDRPGANDPVFEGKVCCGRDLSSLPEQEIWDKGIDIEYIIKAYNDVKALHPEVSFFGKPDAKGRYWIDYLFGTDKVRKSIENGRTAADIKADWSKGLSEFKTESMPYLLY